MPLDLQYLAVEYFEELLVLQMPQLKGVGQSFYYLTIQNES